MRTLEKADRELAEGHLWRAKEILQGSLPNAGYDVELFEKLGIVLLRMGDLPEAGKFFFLSGVRKPEYEQAVVIFLRKYAKNKPHDLFRFFPRGARLAALSEYPDEVTRQLRELGFPESLKSEDGKVTIPSGAGSDAVAWITCSIIASVLGALIVLGIIKLKEIAF
ncbi:MAG: DUF6584 family protein [Pyrinomonadaceae bacterium]